MSDEHVPPTAVRKGMSSLPSYFGTELSFDEDTADSAETAM